MDYSLLPPDAIVKGTLNSIPEIQAAITLNLSLFHAQPAGACFITIYAPDKKNQVNKYTVSSNCPVHFETLQKGRVKSIKAAFINTTAYNSTTNETSSTCRTIFIATQTKVGIWTGAMKIVYPDGRNLTVRGQFHGSILINRQVTGKRLISELQTARKFNSSP